MKFSLSWLKTHLETDASLQAIETGLTAVGLEVEGVENRGAVLAPFTVAHVVEARQHPNADRLRVCLVDTGKETLQVVCGAPNARTGMKGVFAPAGTTIPRTGVVLKKSNIRGEDSNGMLCSAYEMGISEDHEGIIELPADAPLGQPFATLMGLDDPVIEIAVTPNRADALGVRGVARDLAAAGLGKLAPRRVAAVPGTHASPIHVVFDLAEAPEACPLFVGRHIRGVRNGASPEWLQRRLTSIGLRPISALVDITNFLTFDVNRPLHVFDAGKVRGGKLVVRLARGGERIAALNGKEYELGAGMVSIEDATGTVSLGGVMGGASTGVDENTVDVFVEAALFDPLRTANTGRRLGVQSDARFRFERGIDPAAVVEGMEAATRLILDLCGGEPSELTVTGTAPDTRREIGFRPERVASLGGVEVAPDRCKAVLEALGFEVAGKGPFTVVPPSWRRDVEGEADLVEEVLRIEGFDKIPATPLPPVGPLPAVALDAGQKRTTLARRALAARGMTEAVTWSFMPLDKSRLFGGGDEALRLANPISSDLDQMRPSVLPNLIAAVTRNADRGIPDLALFEVGPAYRDATPEGQERIAAGIRSGHAGSRHWSAPRRAVDPFDVKADVLGLLAELGVPTANLATSAEAPAWYHPGRSAVLKLGPKAVLARFGEIHPAILRAFDVEVPVMGFEVLLDALPQPKARAGRAKPLLKPPAFQAVERDFAFLVPETVAAEALARAARLGDKELITRVSVFDVYQGKGMPDGMKSVAISVELQPSDRTLTDAEIEAVAGRVVASVVKATGGSLRG